MADTTHDDELIVVTTEDVAKVEAVAEAAAADADEANQRAWLETILPLSKFMLPKAEWETQVDQDTQAVLDGLLVVVCARIKRIMRSDLK